MVRGGVLGIGRRGGSDGDARSLTVLGVVVWVGLGRGRSLGLCFSWAGEEGGSHEPVGGTAGSDQQSSGSRSVASGGPAVGLRPGSWSAGAAAGYTRGGRRVVRRCSVGPFGARARGSWYFGVAVSAGCRADTFVGCAGSVRRVVVGRSDWHERRSGFGAA